MHYFVSSFAIILKRQRKLVASLVFSYRYIVTINVLWLFLTVPWIDLHCVIVVYTVQTHFFTENKNKTKTYESDPLNNHLAESKNIEA